MTTRKKIGWISLGLFTVIFFGLILMLFGTGVAVGLAVAFLLFALFAVGVNFIADD